MIKFHVAFASGVSLLVLASFDAQAVESAAGESTASQGGGESTSLEEITVTARKRTERLMDVPVAATVFSEKDLQRYGTASLGTLSAQIPQVSISPSMGSSTGAVVTIRGLGSNANADQSIEQSVSFNIDNVSSARGRLVTEALFDLSDVEILKGPQALYFGKNSPGGVIIVSSKGPTDHLEGYAKAGYEFRTREYRIESAVGGPITETLGIRVALFRSDMYGGYVKNIAEPVAAADNPIAYERVNGIGLPGAGFSWGPQTKQDAGRITLRFDPGANFDATLKVTGTDYKDNGDNGSLVDTSCPVGLTKSTTTDLGAIFVVGAPVQVADPYSVCGQKRFENSFQSLPAAIASRVQRARDGTPYSDSKAWLASLTMNYALDKIKLTSVTGYYKGDEVDFNSGQLLLIPASQEEHTRTFTEEIRAASDFQGPVNFTVGAYYSNDKLDTPYMSGLLSVDDPTNPGHVESNEGYSNGNGHSFSGFGELRVALAPDLELAGGARYTHEQKSSVLENTFVNSLLPLLGPIALPPNILVPGRISNANVSPQATLTWKTTPDVTLYAAFRTGFKSGGVIHPGLIPGGIDPALPEDQRLPVTYGPETIKGYEAGVKFQAFERRLTGDITAYNYLLKGLQISAFDSRLQTIFLKNAGSARTTGIEGNFNYRATSDITLRSNFGYNHARFTSFPGSSCFGGQLASEGCDLATNTQNLTGAPLSRAPLWQVTDGVSWDRPVTSKLALGASVDAHYSTGYFTTTTDSPFGHQGAYATLDSSVRLHDIGNKWEVALIGQNLTNTFYSVIGADRPLAPRGSVYSQVGVPVTINLQGTYNF